MKNNTILVTPIVFSNIKDSNVIDISNSFLSYKDYNNDKPITYKRSNCGRNYGSLIPVLAMLYGVQPEHCLLFSSGVAVSSCISGSKLFKRILVFKTQYPDMVDSFRYNNIEVEIIEEDFDSFKEGDLLCFETVEIPSCIKKDYTDIIQRAKKSGVKIFVDNTIPTWFSNDCKEYDPDFIMESLSKFGNGMNNSLIGFLYCKSKEDQKILANCIKNFGYYPHPIDCYLTQCGLQTMSLRLKQIQRTTLRILEKIEENDINMNILNVFVESGLIFVKNKNNRKIPQLNVIQHADTFGAPYTVVKEWESEEDDKRFIRICIGLEDYQDIVFDIINIIKKVME